MLISFYIVLVITFCGILNKGTSESVSEGFQQGHERKQMSIVGVFNSLPLIIFSFMYQINIPAIYTELKVKTMPNVTKVLATGTGLACFAYILAGMFGYIAFTSGTTDE